MVKSTKENKKPKFVENLQGYPCKNIEGVRSGKLVAIEPCDPPAGYGATTDRNQWWLCSCDCGGSHKVKGLLVEKGCVTRCTVCRENAKKRNRIY